MKKIYFITLSLTIISLAGVVFAQGAELPAAGITPDSPLYFLERIYEGIGTFFTFGDLKKAERYAALASERVAEAEVVAGKGKSELAEKTLKRYEDQLASALLRAEKAEAKGQNIESVSEKVAEATGKHLVVLERVIEKVPESAKGSVENAKEASMTGQKTALLALAKENPERATEINLDAMGGRLDRAKIKADQGEDDEAEKAVKEFEDKYRFGKEISQIAKELGKDTTAVEQLVGRTTSIHLEVLSDVYEKVPEQAQQTILKVMEVTVIWHEEVVESLKEKDAIDDVPEDDDHFLPSHSPDELLKIIRERREEKEVDTKQIPGEPSTTE